MHRAEHKAGRRGIWVSRFSRSGVGIRSISASVVIVSYLAMCAPMAYAQASKASPTAVSATTSSSASGGMAESYRIGPEDVLEISVWRNEAISRSVPVRPDGKISLPLVNEVQAAGFTPAELRTHLAKLLSEFIPTPEVSIIVREVNNFRVFVIGEVARPGRYQLKSATSVLEVIAQVGGLTQFASRSRLFVLRTEGGAQKRIPFNYNKAVAADGEQENFQLQPGDMLIVP
jgi:polysaccharide export outer membrane protein